MSPPGAREGPPRFEGWAQDGVGLDVGSTTLKVVAVREGRIVFDAYRRHRGDVRSPIVALLAAARAAGGEGALAVTGSAGAALATHVDGTFVHEVSAIAAAARVVMPEVRTIVELGGQDSKLLSLDGAGSVSTEWNERCAAGTGVVIDRIASRLGLAADELASLTYERDGLPVVSSRCGVFAESDVVGLVKAGERRERALAALFDAVVRQTMVTLGKGRGLEASVCLLGGPHAFIPALAAAWRPHLEVHWAERGLRRGPVLVPADAQLFAALGAVASIATAARLARARRRGATLTARHLETALPNQPGATHRSSALVPTPVVGGPSSGVREAQTHGGATESVANAREDDSFSAVFGLAAATARATHPPTPARAEASKAGVFLGLDAGSTSVKAVAVDAAGRLVAHAYARSGAHAFADATTVLARLGARLDGARVLGLGVTGYAAKLLGPVFGADTTIVETLAHARSARWFFPDADVVCDVGGQDIKVLALAGAEVRSFFLSQQCAAGNGALLETTAEALGVPLDRLAQVTATATRVPRFASGCAVFLDTERVTAQRDGWTPAEVLAGMTAVLPRNIWEHVVAAPSLEHLGDVFVLSGGVQRNAAAVQAQVTYLAERHPRSTVVVHPYPGEAGALGAALAARDVTHPGRSTFVGFEQLRHLEVSTRSDEHSRCNGCPSRCSRTIVSAHRGEHLHSVVTGQGCEVGASLVPSRGAKKSTRGVNLLRHEATRLFRRHHQVRVVSNAGHALRVGIPRVLAQYRAAPLFTHYLEALGVPRHNLVISDFTSEALWRRGANRATTEACFPARVAQAHVAQLLAERTRRPFDVLFFPAVTHAVTSVTGCTDTASCPVVAGAPLLTRATFEADAEGRLPEGVVLLTPALVLSRRRELSQGLFEALREVLPGLDRETHEAALTEGITAQRAWDGQLEALGAAALLEARRTGRCAVLVIGRPYHVDPGLHHELASELSALGRTSLSLRALPHSEALLAQTGCRSPYHLGDVAFLTNSGDGERLAAARFAGAFPWLVTIELSSFKCGQDASLYAEVAAAARGEGGKPFLALHDLDETRPVASLRLRLETFLDAVTGWERRLSEVAR
ncbi:MAG: BadF/BadG/BcrA/BcrD ATPase family protein [Myxococcales bacterium]|nr:BadF/BadG/BcrA/BcrD ATPase family protein [Myxococcales bacterium]